MNHCFKNLTVNKIHIARATDLIEKIKDNWLLSLICFIAIALHIYPLSFPISLAYDEPTHLMGGVGLYMYINLYWQKLSSLPVQYIFWIMSVAALIFINSKKSKQIISDKLHAIVSRCKSHSLHRYIFTFLVFCLLIIYFYAMRNLPYHPNLVRFPPVGKLLYLGSYLFVGINKIGPRILQLLFYTLTAVYLYRTIALFRDKETALLGATIFLFTPLMFFYANRGELALGNIFFIVLISYHFIKFIKDNNDADIVLVSLFIGLGFLYKRTVFLMLFICILYLILIKLKDRDFKLIRYVSVLLFALIPVIPWMTIAKFYVWREYSIVWSHLITFDILISYLSIIASQASWIIFALFMAAIFFGLLRRRDTLTLFFALLFITYYLFFTADMMFKIDRFSLALYPSIAVFTAQFMSACIHKVKWKHSFNAVISVLTCYLLLICTVWDVPQLNPKFVTYKSIDSRYFPIAEAMVWVKNNVKDGEKILIIQVPPALFYRDKYMIDKNKIIDFWYSLDNISTPDKFYDFYNKKDISYIMYSFGPAKDIDHNADMQTYLINNMHTEFKVLAEFKMDSNYIYIFKPKGI